MIESCKLLGDIALANSDDNSGLINQMIESVSLKRKDVNQKIMNLIFNLQDNSVSMQIRDISEDDARNYNFVGNTSAPKAPLWRFASTNRAYILDIYYMLINFHKHCVGNEQAVAIQQAISDVLDTFFVDLTISGGKLANKPVNLKILNTDLLDFEVSTNDVIVPTTTLSDKQDYKFWKESFQKEFIKPLLALKNLKDENISLNIATIVTKDGESICLPQTEVYTDVLVTELFNLDSKVNNNVVCNLCGKSGCIDDFSLKYAIFQRTKKNWAYNLSKSDYNNKMSLCADCYKSVVAGESILGEKFSINIGDNNIFLAPRFIENTDDATEYINDCLESFRNVAMTQHKFFKHVTDVVNEAEDVYDLKGNFFIDMYFYEEMNAATKIKQSIYNVDVNYFLKVINTLKEYPGFFGKERFYNLNSIYYIYESSTSKGDKLKASNLCKRDLGLILNHIPIKRAAIVGEAYVPIRRAFYRASASNKDYEVNKKVHILNFYLDKLEELGLLEKTDKSIVDINLLTGLKQEDIDFIINSKFTDLEAGLYLLGNIVNEVAYVQNKSSNHKAILNALNMRGMNYREVTQLITRLISKINELSKKEAGKYLTSSNNTIKFALAQELILQANNENKFARYTKEEILNTIYLGYLQSAKQAILISRQQEENKDVNNN